MTYATVDDVIAITGEEYTAAEQDRLSNILDIVSAELRVEASKYGVNLDTEVTTDEDYAALVKEVVCTCTLRYMASDPSASPMSQTAEAALGYSVSGSYLVPGGGLYFTKGEKKRLGFLTQKIGGIDLYEIEPNDYQNSGLN